MRALVYVTVLKYLKRKKGLPAGLRRRLGLGSGHRSG